MTPEHLVFMLSLFGAIGIPGVLCFAVFYKALGPEVGKEAREQPES